MEFVGKELFHTFIIEIKAGAAGNGFLCFPYPLLHQMTWALDQDSFGWFGDEMSNCKPHEGVG